MFTFILNLFTKTENEEQAIFFDESIDYDVDEELYEPEDRHYFY
ncbi:hypothetical protein [Cytobacillus purgationiresistens]|uniref:Uncharacterized protein n=1 Tax=Cytobacillus purgationiresistens TaxID=863449 RepID=A0ABU0AHS8_9BACI|nr:hypothetical protein [Cytobacillus purgationiresistens]MDQ0270811.1 hypothetical protein [Cytobacillus purgationiresistens]